MLDQPWIGDEVQTLRDILQQLLHLASHSSSAPSTLDLLDEAETCSGNADGDGRAAVWARIGRLQEGFQMHPMGDIASLSGRLGGRLG